MHFFPFFFFFLKTWLPCKKPQTKLSFFVLVWMCVCGCVPAYPLEMCAFPSCPSVFQPRDALTFDCGDDGECTGYLLIRLSCSVTGRINQSGGWLCTYIFQAHLRTSGEEITVLASQIWSTNAAPLCHGNLRWRCYYVGLSKVIKSTAELGEARLDLPDSFYILRRRGLLLLGL